MSIPMTDRDVESGDLRIAETAIALAPTEPEQAQALLESLPSPTADDGVLASMIDRARGLIEMTRVHGNTALAMGHFRAAIAAAERAGARQRAGQARMSLAFLLFVSGQTQAALTTTAAAERDLEGLERARLIAQRALILSRIGRYEEAFADYDEALQFFRSAGDTLWESRLRMNRGWVHGYLGRWEDAEKDLLRSESLSTAIGHVTAAAEARHNLGFVAALRGDLPAALAFYDEAGVRYRKAGKYRGDLLLDLADVLLTLRLVEEGVSAAREAVAETAARRMSADHAEAQLRLAQALLASGGFEAAHECATAALAAFHRQRRPAWAALARLVAVRLDWEVGHRDDAALRRARRATAELTNAGWMVAALDARLIAARLALQLGRQRVARAELLHAAAARRSGPADLRARAWHAEALLRLAEGNRRGAQTAVRAGLGVLERFQASLGATELRAHVSGHGERLAKLGLRMSLEDRRAAEILGWAERWRSGALVLRPARPPDDADLADELAQLRRTVAELDEAALEGRDTTAILRRQAVLEERVRRRARHARGARRPVTTVSIGVLHEALGDRALVEYIGLDGHLHAVVLAGGRASLHHLGDRGDVEREVTSLRFALRRLAHSRGSERSLAAASRAAGFAAQLLDAALIGPLRGRVADRDTVLVPTGALHALPWSALPSLTGRAATVAPSAALWHRGAIASAVATDDAVLVAGPGLAHAEREIAALARQYPQRHRFGGRRAAVAPVLAALDGSGLAHIAAHGRFRSDNPMFSSLVMADGPLTVYDLERLERAPEVVVLSACDAGLSDVHPGDELMGLSSALFALGARTLIASVSPVPDEETRHLMRAFHRHLRSGLSPAPALARAQDATPAGAGFVCFGVG